MATMSKGWLTGYLLIGISGIGLCGWYGYGALAKYQAKKDLHHAGITYSEASMIESACAGRSGAVILFLKAGMQVNVKGHDENTPLHCIARKKNETLLAHLLALGADVNASNKAGRTPLMEATQVGDLSSMQRLIQAGADINAADTQGNTSLILAGSTHCGSQTCKADIVKLLLRHGANPKSINRNGESILFRLATSGGRENASATDELLDTLIKAGADINAGGNNGKSILSTAAGQGRLDLVQKLITLGANVDGTGERETPLMGAVRSPPIVKALLDAKANPNLSASHGNTPLLAAIQARNVESVNLLLLAHANPLPTDPAQEGALQAAVQIGHLPIITALVGHGVDLNAKDGKGNTALHALARYGGDRPDRIELAKKLVTLGADPAVRDASGQTPAELAARHAACHLAAALSGVPAASGSNRQKNRPTAVPCTPRNMNSPYSSMLMDSRSALGAASLDVRQPSATAPDRQIQMGSDPGVKRN